MVTSLIVDTDNVAMILLLALSAAATPEMEPAAMLPRILRELKMTLPDASSIKDMRLCPPKQIKYKAGIPIGWTVLMSFNARGPNGGYEGEQQYYATFKGSRVRVGGGGASFGYPAIEEALRKDALRKMALCPTVPEAAIRAAAEM